MKVLITGATGYLGRAVVAACRDAGHETISFSRSAARSGLPGALVDGDVRDAGAVRRSMAGCDAVCHLAALVAVWRRRADEFDRVNVEGLRNVIAAAASLDLSRVVYTSSFLALPPSGDGEPRAWNDYQRTKADADRLADAAVRAGAPIVRLYPGVLYGPGPMTEGNLVGRMIADHLAGRLPGLVGADRAWSYSWLEDVAAAHVTALERGAPGRRHLLGGETATQMRVFELVRELTARPLPRRIPAPLAVAAGAAGEAWGAITGRPPALTVGTVEILLRDWMVPSEAARRELGYRVTPLREGIGRIVEELGRRGSAGGASRP
ncbi:MAG TPA: NAD-dependent epimerase/dehydratase family protein [Vicinamibacterales bacterium]|nr:NAD-dependent epimerase/dehydratase family protein [Vicinamibacterales bacterium]